MTTVSEISQFTNTLKNVSGEVFSEGSLCFSFTFGTCIFVMYKTSLMPNGTESRTNAYLYSLDNKVFVQVSTDRISNFNEGPGTMLGGRFQEIYNKWFKGTKHD